tara:strand:+ start:21 stop:1106 length:1086 start_codon:yes stop_codon:yes gene_type:complete
MGSNNQMLPILLLVACCLSSSAASGAGAYFLGYVPGNDKYYTRIFQLEKMFQILEDIKTEMVYEGTAPNEYTGMISGTVICDEVTEFYENLVEKRDEEIEKVTDADFTKLVETYMDDNEIEGYTYDQAIDIIEFMYTSCDEDTRVFKKTADFTDKLTKLFDMVTPTTNTFTAQKAFCDDVTGADDVVTKGFTSLHKEITDVTDVSSLGQVWDESTGTLGPSGFSLTDLTSSVDYCKTPIDKTCGEITDKAACDTDTVCTWTEASDATDSTTGTVTTTPASCGDALCSQIVAEGDCPTSRCEWTADMIDSSTGLCGVIPACNTFSSTASIPSATTDCPLTRCEWDDTAAVGLQCGDIPLAGV